MARKRDQGSIDPWDNLQIRWDTPPDRVHLKTDASVSWPFGDGEWMTGLDDRYFAVYLKKAWALCREEALNRPVAKRDAFLAAQRRRLDQYKADRKSGKKH